MLIMDKVSFLDVNLIINIELSQFTICILEPSAVI